MDWRDEPATERQHEYIKFLGGQTFPQMTKGQASGIITKIQEQPDFEEKRAAWLKTPYGQQSEHAQREIERRGLNRRGWKWYFKFALWMLGIGFAAGIYCGYKFAEWQR